MPLLRDPQMSTINKSYAGRCALFGLLIFTLISGFSNVFADTGKDKPPSQSTEGIFLVATDKLHGSSFQQSVILLTHYSDRGATGLTINRPAGISLMRAFPGIRQLRQRTDPLFLGGPVSTNAIFVLLRTLQPGNSMHRIAGDIYFSTGKNAFEHSPIYSPQRPTRTYAGYAGWTAGQLQNEISRGDWLMVHTHPDIIFEKDTDSLWQRLTKRWTGKWI